MNKRFIIIPGCCDLNRGDQALGWETHQIALDANFVGDYSIIAEENEPVKQSIKEGYEILLPALEHPSRKFKNKDNIIYDFKKKFIWGYIAIKDFLFSFLLLNKLFRKIYLKLSKNTNKIKTLKRFEECEAVFMKGGGLIQSHGGIISTYATYYRLYHIFLALSFNKKVYIMPNSFGPFEGPLVKKMVKYAFEKCVLVTSRERISQDIVKKELGINIKCFPDLAFYLKNGSYNREKLCRLLGMDIKKPIIAITMRPYRFPDSYNPNEAYNSFKKEMQKFIIWLYENNYNPLIIEHTFAITSHESDGSCIKDVVKDIDNSKYFLFSDNTINCRELKSVYGCCDYIIGTRFHSLIFSLSNYIPGIAISYDGYKSIGIMNDMGLGEYVVKIDEVSHETLISKFLKIKDNKEIIMKNIKEYIEKANMKREELINLMKGE